MNSPTQLIDASVLSGRVRDYGLNTLSPVVTMVMSGVYATSALALADILRTPDDRWVRLSFWFVLMLSATYMMTRQLHMNGLGVHPVPSQLPEQLVLGFVTAASFGCLPLSTGGPDGWRFAISLVLLVIPLTVRFPAILSRWLRIEHYSPSLQPAVRRRLDDVLKSFRRLPVISVVLLAVVVFAWATRAMDPRWTWVIVGFNVVFCARLLYVLWLEIGSFRHFVEAVEQARLTETTELPAATTGETTKPAGSAAAKD